MSDKHRQQTSAKEARMSNDNLKERLNMLEANLANAVKALEAIEDASRFFARDRESSDTETLSYAHETTRRLCATTLAEIKGEK